MKCKKCGSELHGLQRCPFCGTTMTTGSYGRIQRSMYWAIMAPCVVVNTLSINGILKNFNNGPSYGHEWNWVLWFILSLACAAVMIRTAVYRLHDLDKSGWWVLVACIPYVGAVVVIVLGCIPGTPGPNQFGRDPTGRRSIPPSSNHGGYDSGQYARGTVGSRSVGTSGAGRCQGCGNRLEPGGKFCPHCGKAVPEKKKCRQCGGELDAGQNFCPRCGKPVVVEAAPCQKCGEKLDSGQKFCPKCGTEVAGSNTGSGSGAKMEGDASVPRVLKIDLAAAAGEPNRTGDTVG